MLKKLIAITILLVTVSCSTQPKLVTHKPVIKSIAIIPATNPLHYTIKNENPIGFLIPIASTATYLYSKNRADVFTAKMNDQATSLAADFTEEVASLLRSYGYKVSILDVTREPDDPDDVDYETISTAADAILHVRFNYVGLYSPNTSTSYKPRVNVSGTLFVVANGEENDLFDEEINYGVDTGIGKDLSIPSDEKFKYSTFEAALKNIDDVREAFKVGAQKIGERMSVQLHDAIK